MECVNRDEGDWDSDSDDFPYPKSLAVLLLRTWKRSVVPMDEWMNRGLR